MESLSKQELISTITKQADQIKRYEARLRDVVAAYKGLAKEKEALDISLKALNKTEPSNEGDGDSVATLTLSLSTLSAEKQRMEEAFQADKKVTREKYEIIIANMKEETKKLVQQHLAEVNNLKAKISYEIQERENERANYAAMMKELHMKLNSERQTKEKLENTVVHSTEAQASQAELEKRVRDLSSSLEASQRRLQRAESRAVETPASLVRLQQQLAALEQSNSIAIRQEQIKVKRAEEAARKICAKQEERVALLEGKLAELSETIGEYDLRRRRDQQTIQQLKDCLNEHLLNKIDTGSTYAETQQKSETDNEKLADSEYFQNLIDKIHILKKELIAENEKLGNPLEISTIFRMEGYEDIHEKCRQALESLKNEFDTYKSLNAKVVKDDNDLTPVVEDLKGEVAMLTEMIESYKMRLDVEKQDKADALKLAEEKLKNEEDYHKHLVADLKTRIAALEKQVQSQRDRYAALLEETDNYIRARSEGSKPVSSVSELGDVRNVLPDVSAPPHMLHYAQELARKDLEVSQLRKEKHNLEGQYRDIQREATIEKERFKEVIRTLKEEIDRLRRIQSREGANLEYLKNVIISFLISQDHHGRKHMLNAIAAVLHFTKAEKDMVLSSSSQMFQEH